MNSQDVLTRPAPKYDNRVAYGPAPQNFYDVRRPRNGGPVALMIHGGYWRNRYDLAHAGHLCAALAGAGLETVNVEYRRVGDPGGGWPGTFEDIMAAVRKARPAVVLGHSAGGHLALRVAAEKVPGLAGVVALAPLADLELAWKKHLSNDAVVEFLGGTPEQVPQRYADACPSRKPGLVRRVVIHGTSDDVVPLELSRRYRDARASDAAPVQLLELPGADHFDLIDPESKYWPAVRDAVLRSAGR